jgi:formylglycine-generating enzyme required for sulfatase activity
MHVFLSYASQDREAADAIRLALAADGHDVFFDREDLPPGDEFDERIRSAIQSSDLMVFLLTPDAVDAGSYTLSELEIARKTWKYPGRRILPVMLRPVPFDRVPPYLKSVTVLAPKGNAAAEVADTVARLERVRVRRLLARIALGLAITAALGAGAGLVWWGREAAPAATGKDGAPMVLVPAGAFIMGDDEDSPRREVYLDAYYIDQYEVTVARYARFLQATGGTGAPDGWESVNVDQHAQLPVVGVGWQDAHAYCGWAGRRLPTEAEWEKAARGTDRRRYPWGDQSPDLERANFANSAPETYDGGLTPVGSHPQGRSPVGAHDMAGNAAEWVADWYTELFAVDDRRNPKGPDAGEGRVIRGGGRFDPDFRITATRRSQARPQTRLEDLGFRCARDVR